MRSKNGADQLPILNRLDKNGSLAPCFLMIPKHSINRRRFLAGTLAAGAGLLSARRLAAAETAADPNCLVLMAATHLRRHREDEWRGVKMAEAFEQASKEILALPKRPAGLIIAGDLAEGPSCGYGLFRDALKPLQDAGLSIHLAIGNHDSREKFLAAFPKMKFEPIAEEKTPSKLVSLWETPEANWFLLDSAVQPRVGSGKFGEAQLAWLAKALDARRDKPALIVAHHHPDPLAKFDGLTDTSAFLKVVLPRSQVKAYFYGHTHIWNLTEMSGMHFVNLPAMAWTFDPTQPRGFVTLQTKPDGATLVVHTFDSKDARHGQKIELAWRK
jgi:3',5'-cyclic-AMP phosphodiesterase